MERKRWNEGKYIGIPKNSIFCLPSTSNLLKREAVSTSNSFVSQIFKLLCMLKTHAHTHTHTHSISHYLKEYTNERCALQSIQSCFSLSFLLLPVSSSLLPSTQVSPAFQLLPQRSDSPSWFTNPAQTILSSPSLP